MSSGLMMSLVDLLSLYKPRIDMMNQKPMRHKIRNVYWFSYQG